MAKPYPHVVNNAFLGTWRPHANFLALFGLINYFSQNNVLWVWLWQKDIHYNTHSTVHPEFQPFKSRCLAVMPKYILNCVRRFNSFGPTIFRRSFFGTFSLYTPIGRGVTKRDSTYVTLKVKSCMYTMY